MCAVPALAHWGFWVDGNSLPDLTVFRPLDIERYAKRLSLEARGAERGAANQPPADALALDDIDWIESAGNYLCIRTGNETLILRETLTKMETRLDPKRFARIHRSRIVNLSRVAKLLPLYNGDHTVVLKDSTELGLSRTYRDDGGGTIAAAATLAAPLLGTEAIAASVQRLTRVLDCRR